MDGGEELILAYPNGKNHVWKLHQFSPMYLQSKCGLLVGFMFPVEKDAPMCKSCAHQIDRPGE